MAQTDKNEVEHQSAFSRATHSIRTRYALATALFLLAILGIFYIGGRITLVHLLRDAERQVKEIGEDIGRLAYRNAGHVRDFVTNEAAGLSAAMDKGMTRSLESFLGRKGNHDVSLAMYLSDEGTLKDGIVKTSNGGSEKISAADFKPYTKAFHEWTASFLEGTRAPSSGLVRIKGGSHYVSLAHIAAGGYLVLGSPFNTGIFSSQVNENFAGATVRVTNRRADIAVRLTGDAHAPESKKPSFGIVPMFSEAVDFYSGGFWKLGSNPFEAVFTIRDIAGNAVSMIAVSLPRTFSKITTLALGRLTFFIAMIGILLILPVFWLQNHMLLNPLSQMIERIREIGERHDDTNCPHLEWDGKDEFAMLAVSVNRMLETISRRAIAVAESESRQRALLAAAPDGFAVFDRSRRLITVIKQPDGVDAFPGLEERQPISPETWGVSGVQTFNSALDAAFAGDRDNSRAHLSVQGGPSARDVEFRFSRMDDHFALALMRDVTSDYAEHRRLINTEQRRGHASKQESMALLAAGIAHDVNNVLSVVLNTAEITWMDETDQDVRSAVETIRDAVRRGSAMMRELMAFAGETKISLKRMDPVAIVREAQRLAKGVTAPNISVSYDLPEGLPAVDVDPDQMWKVFFNLIKNASEAMKSRPGVIEVSVRKYDLTQSAAETFMCSSPLKPGTGVLFRISDNGPGINPLLLRRIFDPYISSKGSGHGLGLAIVYATVDAHGGGIRVSSALECGTAFEIFLPVSTLPASDAAPAPDAPDAAGDILLVDDDDNILRTTSILLRTLKASVHTAKDRYDALLKFRALAPRLKAVLLDAHIGPLSTVRLLRIFRLVAPNVPVVVTSGTSQEAIAELFTEQPYNAFLAKPYTLGELKAALAEAETGLTSQAERQE